MFCFVSTKKVQSEYRWGLAKDLFGLKVVRYETIRYGSQSSNQSMDSDASSTGYFDSLNNSKGHDTLVIQGSTCCVDRSLWESCRTCFKKVPLV